ncbi:MAG: pitrilysin family protein, partial [Bacillota bacterium]|nr:pitrilysin family protein [Bacillota bacterium]
MVQGKKQNHYLGIVFAFFVFFSFIMLPSAQGASTGADSPLGPFTRIKMENGLTLIVKEVHSAPIAAVDIWIGTGAKNETPEIAGLSHFFEHMLFKGTAKRKVGEIAQEIKAVGGYQNAETSLDTTHYFVVVPSKEVSLALDVEADAVMNSSFDPHEIDKERQVILEEKRLKEDSPQGKLGLMAYQTVFKGTPYANDVLGTSETLSNINHDIFVRYFHQHYIPGNIVVVVVGDVDTAQIVNQAQSLFKDFKGQANAQADRQSSEIKVPKLREITRINAKMQVDQTYLYLGFPGPGMNDSD